MSELTPAAPQHRVEALFHHVPHPRIAERKHDKPAMVEDERVGVNGKVALIVTAIVGTMWCAYAFAVLALVVLPQAVQTPLTLVQWVSQTFIQLVLLSVIMVGQNIQGKASDKRAIQTYKDAEAILSECLQLQAHLEAQDKILDDVIKHVRGLARAEPAT